MKKTKQSEKKLRRTDYDRVTAVIKNAAAMITPIQDTPVECFPFVAQCRMRDEVALQLAWILVAQFEVRGTSSWLRMFADYFDKFQDEEEAYEWLEWVGKLLDVIPLDFNTFDSDSDFSHFADEQDLAMKELLWDRLRGGAFLKVLSDPAFEKRMRTIDEERCRELQEEIRELEAKIPTTTGESQESQKLTLALTQAQLVKTATAMWTRQLPT